MKSLSLLALGCTGLVSLISLGRSQTPVRGEMPPVAVDTPQLFIPGQTPATSPQTSLVIPAAPAATPETQISERNFVNALISANQRELRIARLATARSQDPAVKAMAQAVIKENATDAQGIANLSLSLGVQNPGAAANMGISDSRLNTLSGADFDAAILKELQRARQSKITSFENARRSTSSPAVQSYVNSTLPLLKSDSQRMGLSSTLPAQPLNSASLPTASPALPDPAGGTLPSATPGTLPSPAGGALPNVSGGSLPSPAGGALPGLTPGTLPAPAGGALPPITQAPTIPGTFTPPAPVPNRPPAVDSRLRPAGTPSVNPAPVPPATPKPKR
jgi:predicted outer membrane protein